MQFYVTLQAIRHQGQQTVREATTLLNEVKPLAEQATANCKPQQVEFIFNQQRQSDTLLSAINSCVQLINVSRCPLDARTIALELQSPIRTSSPRERLIVLSAAVPFLIKIRLLSRNLSPPSNYSTISTPILGSSQAIRLHDNWKRFTKTLREYFVRSAL